MQIPWLFPIFIFSLTFNKLPLLFPDFCEVWNFLDFSLTAGHPVEMIFPVSRRLCGVAEFRYVLQDGDTTQLHFRHLGLRRSFHWNLRIDGRERQELDLRRHRGDVPLHCFNRYGRCYHYDVKIVLCYWPFVWGIHRKPVDSSHKGPVTRNWCFLWCSHEHMVE